MASVDGCLWGSLGLQCECRSCKVTQPLHCPAAPRPHYTSMAEVGDAFIPEADLLLLALWPCKTTQLKHTSFFSAFVNTCCHFHSTWALEVLSQIPSKCLHVLLRQKFKVPLHLFVHWHSLKQQHSFLSPTICTEVRAALAAGNQVTSVHPRLSCPI